MRRTLTLSIALLAGAAPSASAQQPAGEDAATTQPAAAQQPPPAAAPIPTPPPLVETPLRATRAQVRRLQRALGVRADGAIGPRTRAALRRWERREGLSPDGRPDPEVLGRLGIDLTPAQLAALAPAPVGSAASEPAPGPPTPAAARAVAAARSQVGTPYARAGATPGGFDCSGLTAWAYAQAGVELPHSSFAQADLGRAVAPARIQAGDLVLFDTAGPGASDVGIATSPTTVISATTRGVREHAIFDAYWGEHQLGARRI